MINVKLSILMFEILIVLSSDLHPHCYQYNYRISSKLDGLKKKKELGVSSLSSKIVLYLYIENG